MLDPLTDLEAPPLCARKYGLVECCLPFGHPEPFHYAIAPTPHGMADVQWADGCPHYAANEWMNSLVEDSDEGMPPVCAFSVPEDGRVHLDWFRN